MLFAKIRNCFESTPNKAGALAVLAYRALQGNREIARRGAAGISQPEAVSDSHHPWRSPTGVLRTSKIVPDNFVVPFSCVNDGQLHRLTYRSTLIPWTRAQGYAAIKRWGGLDVDDTQYHGSTSPGLILECLLRAVSRS